MATCSWSTTSSSGRTKKERRKSSSTPSTPCTTPASRSSSPATARPSGWSPWRTGCAAGSSGDCSPTSSRPSWRPGSPSSPRRPAQDRLNAPPAALEYTATRISTTIRELEGALIRVTAFASLNRQSVDLQLAEIVLKDLIPEAQGPRLTLATIMGQTASYFGLSMEDLSGTSRSRVLVTARHIAMYLCRELPDLSLPKIGQQFGGRDHTTVMNADRKIRGLMAERRSIYNQVTELTNRIKQQARTG